MRRFISTRFGTGAMIVDATSLWITMDVPPTDSGNGWFYELTSVPPKVQTTSGGQVNPSGGDVEFE